MSRGLPNRALHHLPLVKSYLEKKENNRLVELARISAERDQHFFVLNSEWARKRVPFNTENVLARLASIDKINGSYMHQPELLGILQSSHWSRIYEYSYVAYQLAKIQRDKRLLDCGCGTTSFQFYLAEQGFEVYGVDDWLPCLEKVASLGEQLALTNLRPTFGNIFELPFRDDYFDGAACISVLEHALPVSPENSKLLLLGAINELLRVMKKEAILVLTFDVNFGPEKRHLTPDEYEDLCGILGIETSELPEDRLYSSDTKEGLIMGKDLAVYSVTLVKA